MYVLDTNSVVFFFKGQGRVGERLLARKLTEVALPAVVLYELEVGVIRSNSPARRREQLETLLDATRVIPFGRSSACGRPGPWRARASGESIGPLDILIAATALASGATLVTHNTREFGRVPGLSV